MDNKNMSDINPTTENHKDLSVGMSEVKSDPLATLTRLIAIIGGTGAFVSDYYLGMVDGHLPMWAYGGALAIALGHDDLLAGLAKRFTAKQ